MDSITDILSQDLLARNNIEERERDVISLEDLNNRAWNYPQCTLVSYECKRKYITSNVSSVVIERFLVRHPHFRNRDMSNILIAGGSVTAAIMNNDNGYIDADLFIYGISLDKVPALIGKLVRSMFTHEHGSIIKTEFATTFISEGHKIQIIHRLYNTPSEILHGFDMGSCSTGILLNEGKVITTSLGKASLEYGINILDMSKRSLNYEARLQKYFDRGFNVVLPDFDMTKIQECNDEYRGYAQVKLKGMDFLPLKIKGDKIECMLYLSRDRIVSDYDIDNSYHVSWLNIINVFNGRELVYYKEWHEISDLIEYLHDNIVEFRPNKYIFKLRDDKGNIRCKHLSNFMSKEDIHSYMDIFLANNDEVKLLEIEKEIEASCIEKAKKLFEEYNAKGGYKPKWITVDPASQITGSFHPAIISKEEFYGQYLKTE